MPPRRVGGQPLHPIYPLSLPVPWAVRGLHLGEAAVHRQLRSRDVAAVVGGEKHHGPGERTAALVAQLTLFAGGPLLAPMDAFRMIEAPSGSNGSAFCTVKSTPFTLMLKIESKNSSVIVPRGANFATPALAKTMSSLPFSRLICAKRRSRSPRFDTSPWTPVTWRPISSTAAAVSGSRRPMMKTQAPS